MTTICIIPLFIIGATALSNMMRTFKIFMLMNSQIINSPHRLPSAKAPNYYSLSTSILSWNKCTITINRTKNQKDFYL